MRKALLLLLAVSLLVLAQPTEAYSYLEASGQTSGTADTDAFLSGMKITTKTPYLIIDEITPVTSATGTYWYVVNSSETMICKFLIAETAANCELENTGNYTIYMGSDGSNFDRRYESGQSYPKEGTAITWEGYTDSVLGLSSWDVGDTIEELTFSTTFHQNVKEIYFSAGNILTGVEAYYSFDDTNISGTTVYDLHNSNDATLINTPTTSVTGKILDAIDTDSASSEVVEVPSGTSTTISSSSFSYFVWVKPESTLSNPAFQAFTWGDGGTNGHRLYYYDGDLYFAILDGTWDTVSYTTTLTGGSWYHLGAIFDQENDKQMLYINGVNVANATQTTNNFAFSGTWSIAGRQASGQYFEGYTDEFGLWTRVLNSTEISDLYASGSGLSYYDFGGSTPAPSATNATERLQQDADVTQTTNVTIGGTSYAPVTTSSVTIGDDALVYVSASVPINPSGENTAYCRVTLDGAEFNNSETTRSLTAGNIGNMLISSSYENLTAGSYDIGLECRATDANPTRTYEVFESSLLVHIMTSAGGDELVYEELTHANIPLTSGVLASDTITTSVNYTEADLTRVLVAEWAANYVYGATGFINVTTELAGVNCTRVDRYGTSGTTGSVGGVCYQDVGSETNSTTYDFKVFGTGTGNLTNTVFHLKEFILHDGEINQTTISGTGSGTVETVTINVSTGHTNPDVVAQAVLSMYSTSGSSTGSFYLTGDGQNSSTVSRTSGLNQNGVLGVHKDFTTIPDGVTTFSLIGDCATCSFSGQNLLAFVTNDVAATPNSFAVTAQNSWDGAAISEFDINLSDGRSFSTTTGTINVPATGQLLNITAVENGAATIPYYANTTLNHNSTLDLELNLSAYTVVNATFNGAKVNNFTVNGTSTTSGGVYVRIFNTTEEVTISNAVSDGGTNLSDQSANVTTSPYLESYTFTMLTANAFNFSLYDEISEALITENMTVELITGATAGTYTTTNGTLYLELLTPSDYTIRYYSTAGSNYTQRDYIQTLTDRQRYDISLYGIENAESTDMVVTIKDTSGDPVEDATVKLLRYYTSCACYNVVEMAKTSAAGESYFVVDAYDGHYKFAVEYAGATEFLSSSPENFIPSGGLVSRTITINLGSAYFESFRALTDVARTLTYNNDTKGLSFTWNDPSGIVSKGCLYAEYLDGVHYTAVTPVCQEASTGSVVITLNNSVSSYKYYAELETSTTYSDYVVFSGVIDKIRESLLQGNTGLGAFLGAGVLMVLALMFSFSAIAVMIITALGVIGMSVLGLASFTTVFITGLATLLIGIAAYLMRS